MRAAASVARDAQIEARAEYLRRAAEARAELAERVAA
jgi:hypothetical protein